MSDRERKIAQGTGGEMNKISFEWKSMEGADAGKLSAAPDVRVDFAGTTSFLSKLFLIIPSQILSTIFRSHELPSADGEIKMYRVLIPILLPAMIGCVSTDGYKQQLQLMIGHPDSELTREWGKPTATDKLPDGNTVLTYHTQREQVIPGNPPDIVHFSCDTRFTVNESHVVVVDTYEGNDCAIRPARKESRS